MPGSSRGSEPVARISASPMSSEPSETRTWCAAASTIDPGAGDDGDLAPLEQRLEALGEPVDHLLLAGLAGRRGRASAGRRRPRTPWRRGRCAGPRRSGAAPWPGCSPDAGRCHRPGPPRPSRSGARPPPRRGRPRSRRGRRRGRRRRSAQPPCSPPPGRDRAVDHCRARRQLPATIVDRSRVAMRIWIAPAARMAPGHQRQQHQRPRLHAPIIASTGRDPADAPAAGAPKRLTNRRYARVPPGTLGAAFRVVRRPPVRLAERRIRSCRP